MEDFFQLADYLIRLKNMERKGWTLRGIMSPESVAEHSYAVSVLSFAMAEKLGMDSSKCVKLALLHDLQESITTDITPHDNMTIKEKSLLEESAINEISSKIHNPSFYSTWREYEDNLTPEAKLVHDMDKIDMLVQAMDYERKFPDKNLDEFFDYVKDKLQLPESQKILEEILKKRVPKA